MNDRTLRSRSRAAEIIACLMKGQRTVSEIAAMAGSKEQTVREWIIAFHASGIVRITGRKVREINPLTGEPFRGMSPLVYELQSSPFEREDALPIPKREKKS